MEKLRILVVDDHALTRRYVVDLLQPLGAEIREAADGRDAYELATRECFDLVITDFRMPRLDGNGFCRKLKANTETIGTPVVMISNFDSDQDIDRGFQAGAAAYLSKRQVEDDLLHTVKESLRKHAFQKDRLVLVVDDSQVVLHYAQTALLEAGFRVTVAADGNQALQLLADARPDLILSDLEMPGMDGLALLKTIRADPNLAEIPFVVMSSHNARSTMRRLISEGAASYLAKPFNMEQLVILVEKLLSDQFQLLLKEKERLETEQRLMLASIASLASALEVRDEYTRGHSEAVSGMLQAILRFAGAGDREIQIGAIAGRLHDIGKIGIRDDILLKPDQLTEEEYTQIKKHPALGAGILQPIPSLAEVVPVVLFHHERHDGLGYPHGLRGEEIPPLARLAAVADTFSALTSDRPYRKRFPTDKALQIILEVRGTQLCPAEVDLFLRWCRDGATELAAPLDTAAIPPRESRD